MNPFVLTALLLTPLTGLHTGRILPEVRIIGKLRVGSFQPLEDCGAVTSNVWN